MSKINKTLIFFFLFLLGSAITFVITLGVIGAWSIPALLAFVALLPFGYLTGAGILVGGGLAFLLLSYLLVSITRFFVRYTIESKISSALTTIAMQSQKQGVSEFELKLLRKELLASQENLLKWLVIANGGNYDKACLGYSSSNSPLEEKPILAYAIQCSKTHWEAWKTGNGLNIGKPIVYADKHYFLSQEWIKFVYGLWKADAPPPSLSRYQSFVLWLKRKLGISFTSSNLDDQAIAQQLKAGLISTEEKKEVKREIKQETKAAVANLPSTGEHLDTLALRETYSSQQLIDRLFSRPVAIRMTPTFSSNRPASATLPSHLKPWLGTLSLTHQQNQQYQQRVQQVEHQELKADLSLNAQEEVLDLVDNSEIIEDEKEYSTLINTEGCGWWLYAIQKSLRREANIEEKMGPGYYKWLMNTFSISKAAKEALVRAGMVKTSSTLGDYYDLHNLPIGFFMEKQENPLRFILKFDPKARTSNPLRVKFGQLAFLEKDEKKGQYYEELKYLGLLGETKERINHRGIEIPFYSYQDHYEKKAMEEEKSWWFDLMDWKRIFPDSNGTDDARHTEKLLTYWYKHLDLTTEQIKFFNDSLCFRQRLQRLHALKRMFKKSSPKDIKDFIEFLRKLDETTSRAREIFCIRYWDKHLDCNWIDFLATLKLMNEFTSEQMTWFEALSADSEIEELVHGLRYFFQFFKDRGLSTPKLPHAIRSFYSRFSHLEGILDCISLAQDQKLQAHWISEMPDTLGVAKKQLRAGYIVIHRAMCFESDAPYSLKDFDDFAKRFQISDPFMITLAEFKAIDYQASENPYNATLYRALFLRYCAAHLDAENFKKAIDQWESLMGEKLDSMGIKENENSEDHSTRIKRQEESLAVQLPKNWGAIRSFVLGLPSRMSAEKDAHSKWSVDPKNAVNKVYTDEDIASFFEKLKLEPSIQERIKDDLDYLNQMALNLPSKQEEFQAAINKAKQALCDAKKGSKEYHQATLDCLVLMREAHFRLTRKKDRDGNLIKQGEWLRLEQAVVILHNLRTEGLYRISTGEGKTLILQLIAMLKSLQGKRVDVITHNEPLANLSCDSLKSLSSLFGLKVAKKENTDEEKESADILYIDISSAVIHQKRSQLRDQKESKEKKEAKEIKEIKEIKEKVALIDEVDNVVIDIHSSTSMQISTSTSLEADEKLEAFLMELNRIVRSDDMKAKNKEAQRIFIRLEFEKLQSKNKNAYDYYQAHCIKGDAILDNWISAAVTAMTLQEKIHYVIESEQKGSPREVIHIIHKDTTGRVDKISHWGKGVHQCVAAWEKSKGRSKVKIPELSKVMAEGHVVHYLQTEYSARSGFTGTEGEAEVEKQIEVSLFKPTKVLPEQGLFIIPPSKKPIREGAAWPQFPRLVSIEEKEKDEKKSGESKHKEIESKIEIQYKSSYSFPPQFLAERKDYLETILTAVRNIQDQNYSGIIFLNTVQECEDFYEFLKLNGIDPLTLQILDDTEADEKNEVAAHLRPGEATIIEQAKKPKMITLSTAAGGRGTNFSGIEVALLAKPGLERVKIQAEGRVGRNGELAITQEIYWEGDIYIEEDLQDAEIKQGTKRELKDLSATESKRADAETEIAREVDSKAFGFFLKAGKPKDIRQWRKDKQALDLQKIKSREEFDKFKQAQQAQFLLHRKRVTDATEIEQLDKAWSDYFSSIELLWQEKKADSPPPSFQPPCSS